LINGSEVDSAPLVIWDCKHLKESNQKPFEKLH